MIQSSPYSIRSTKTFAIVIFTIAVFFWAFSAIEFTPQKVIEGFPPLFDFLYNLYPPDVTVAPTLLESAVETIQMVLSWNTCLEQYLHCQLLQWHQVILHQNHLLQ